MLNFNCPQKIRKFRNLTQQQLNDILKDAYAPANKDARSLFPFEYGDLIKVETNNVGYDIVAEKGKFLPCLS